MRIKIRHLQAALSVLAENDQYYEAVRPLADLLDQNIEQGEVHQDDVIVEF